MPRIKLTELKPKWITWGDMPKGGISFQCPIHLDGDCKDNAMVENRVHVPFKEVEPKGWTHLGDSFEDMSLSPSIMAMNEDNTSHWHGFVKNGYVEW